MHQTHQIIWEKLIYHTCVTQLLIASFYEAVNDVAIHAHTFDQESISRRILS